MRGCVPDWVSLRSNFINGSVSSRYSDHFGHVCRLVAFQIGSLRFYFHEWLKFRADTRIILVVYAPGCVPDSVLLRFEFSFMNGSSFELCSDHFGVAMLAIRQELESQVQQAH